MAYVLPTGYSGGSGWQDISKCYDGSLTTFALTPSTPAHTWCSYLELTHASMYCDKIRFYTYANANVATDLIDIDAYYSGGWHDVYEGVMTDETWVEKSLASAQYITSFRIRYYNHYTLESNIAIREINFSQTIAIPTVTSQAVSSILASTATGNGTITALGGENCTKRGVCYSTSTNPTVANSKVEATGDFETGAFTALLTGLLPGTTYHCKAYAYNSAGYAYGDEVDFTTLTPTVTSQAVSAITHNTATGNGNITVTGGTNATKRGICCSTSTNPTVADSKVEESGSFGTGAFTEALTGLSPYITYHAKAYIYSFGNYYYGF